MSLASHFTDPTTLGQVRAAVLTQPSLFDEEGLELEHEVAAAARRLFAKKWEITGKIATKNEAKAAAVVLCLQAGMSRRQIRERVSVHHYTIDAIEAAAEIGGNLEPVATRLRANMARLVMQATEEARGALDCNVRNLESAAWLKAVATVLGVSADKHQLLTGAPTEILEHRSAPGRGELEAWLQSAGLQVVHPVSASDVDSAVPHGNPNESAVSIPETTPIPTPYSHQLLSGPTGPEAALEPDSAAIEPEPEPARPAPASTAGAGPRETPGGGLACAAPPAEA
jgi:hypothetical protein